MAKPKDVAGELQPARIPEPVAVTGATGFIGRRLVARLLADGYKVVALALPSDAIPIEWAGKPVVVRRGDVTRRGDVVEALAGTNFVFHLAAVVSDWGAPAEHERVTVKGTENVLTEAAARGQRALLVSSIAAYGDRLTHVICDEDTDPGGPLGPYSASKQAQERIARRLEGERGLQVTIVRPANVYGPGSGPWVDELCRQLTAGNPTLVGGGNFAAGLVYVDNVVEILVRAAERVGAVGRTYNANDDHGVTWSRYVNELAVLTSSRPPRSVPGFLATASAHAYESVYRLLGRNERPSVTREALNLCRGPLRVPVDRARRELGYVPVVSYDDGMKRIAEHLRRRGMPRGEA